MPFLCLSISLSVSILNIFSMFFLSEQYLIPRQQLLGRTDEWRMVWIESSLTYGISPVGIQLDTINANSNYSCQTNVGLDK